MFCPHCGFQLDDDYAFCISCGASLAKYKDSEPQQEGVVYPATREIENRFNAAELKGVEVIVSDDNSLVKVGFAGDMYPGLDIFFISSDEDTDVTVRIFKVVGVPEGSLLAALEAVNKLNREYRFLKFYVDEDRDIQAQYDFPMNLPLEKVGETAFETLIRFSNIMEKAYPVLANACFGAMAE